MSVDIAYIGKFLNEDGVEGPRQTRGYIPARPGNFYGKPSQDPARYTAIGASGVTIATGCDLGQTDAAELKAYGVPNSLIEKLSPYLRLSSGKAIYKLSKMPLTITEHEAETLDDCIHNGELNKYIRPNYDRNSTVKFDDLPKQAQTVIFSMCYQLGCSGIKRRAPRTWYFLINQMWADASNELIYGFRDYKGRRRLEGLLLKEIV